MNNPVQAASLLVLVSLLAFAGVGCGAAADGQAPLEPLPPPAAAPPPRAAPLAGPAPHSSKTSSN